MSCENNKDFVIDDDNMLMEYCGNGGDVVIPNGVSDIFFQAFYGDFKITSVVVPGSVVELAPVVFERLESLKKVILKEGIEVIGVCAFNCCSNLEVVNLPKSLKRICMGAFSNCSSLKEIYYNGTKEEWNLIEKEDDWDEETSSYQLIFKEVA